MHLYSALLSIECTPKALYNHVGGLSSTTTSVQHPTWMMRWLPQDNAVSALTTHQLQVERRESHRAIKWMGVIRRLWLTRARRNLVRTPGLNPYSLRGVPWDFLLTTESLNSLTSHSKDGCLLDSIVSRSLYWGR